jgi:hypothetical protein
MSADAPGPGGGVIVAARRSGFEGLSFYDQRVLAWLECRLPWERRVTRKP